MVGGAVILVLVLTCWAIRIATLPWLSDLAHVLPNPF